ncbi:MAG: hypothetical protein IKR23_09270 [Lachnospiraceae bacterium]|nr:hypothetical protein [Lachnospiraceae bacterium]
MNEIIPAKLHLGDKTLLSDVIPAGTAGIGDWAYAHCSSLKWLAMPVSVQDIGKEVFIGCPGLKHIFVYDTPEFTAGSLPDDKDAPVYMASRLNALAMQEFSDPLKALICGAGNRSLNRWDEECLKYLSVPDEHGFDPFLAGGEEDYGDHDDQLKQHIHVRRLCKANIIYTRLLSNITAGFPLSPEAESVYLALFRENPAAIALLDEIGSHYTQAADIYAKAGLLTTEALPSILSSLKPDRIEIRSALIGRERDSVLSSLAL